MKKIILFVLCIILSVGCFSGCNNNSIEPTVVSEPEAFNSTQYILVQNGVSLYSIVIPEKASESEKTAAGEIQLFTQKSTGCILPILSDSQVNSATDGKYLSVGRTTLFNQTGIVTDIKLMKDCGPLIKTIDDDVFMCGAYETGTLYSAYKFLYYQFGFMAYALDCVKIDYYPNTSYVLDFDYTFVPTVDVYTTAAKEWLGGSTQRRIEAMRMYMLPWYLETSLTMEGPEYSTFCHTMQQVISKALYVDRHPEWFNSGQYCLTNEEFIAEFSKNLLAYYILPYDSKYVMIGGDDNNSYCKCDKCNEDYRQHGGTGGTFVRFANKVAAICENYFEENGIDREITLVLLAYAGYQNAPVVENDDGSLSPVDETVICDMEGKVKVGIDFSALHMCSSHDLADKDCSINVGYHRNYKGWALLSDYLTWYVYTCNYTQPKLFHNDWWALSDLVESLDHYDTDWVYDAGRFRQPLSSMRFWVRRQMLWDKTNEVEPLINEFMSEYYGVGAKYVREYFDALCHQTEAFYTLMGDDCVKCFTVTGSKTNWPHEALLNFANILENGMFAIENSDMTSEDKEIYTERIYREWVLVKVMEYSLYANDVDDKTLKELEVIVKYAREVYNLVYF